MSNDGCRVMTPDQFALQCAALDLKDAKIEHAQFVRNIREWAVDDRYADDYLLDRIVALCDAELKPTEGDK